MTPDERLQQWEEEQRYDRIIEELEQIPVSEMDLFSICELALAYNNTNRLDDSIELLLRVWDIGEQNAVWNYYLGYALVFTGRRREAREYLLHARDLDATIPAQELLHFCICYDEPNETQVNDAQLAEWVRALLDGSLEGGAVRVPELGLVVRPWIDSLQQAGGSALVSLFFELSLPQETKMFECCVGSGDSARDAVCAALGSFYIGVYSAVEKMLKQLPIAQFQDERNRTWRVYAGNVFCMGSTPPITQEHYVKFLTPLLPAYVSGRSFAYVKLYGAVNGGVVTAECRVDDFISERLSKLLQEELSPWSKQAVGSHKQFFLLSCENTVYPYSQAQMDKYVEIALSAFAQPGQSLEQIAQMIETAVGDHSLTQELCAFLPELCAARAFPKLSFSDKLRVRYGGKSVQCTRWQLTAYHMIANSLSELLMQAERWQEAFRNCMGMSSTLSAILQAKEDKGLDLVEKGGKISHSFSFDELYELR